MSPEDKSALRARLLAARRAIPEPERARRSRAVAERVAALPAFAAAPAVALYAPLGAEVDTGELARLALRAGKRLLWPRIVAGSREMDFAACAPGELVAGPRGALEPPRSAPGVRPGAADLVCVPGVGFDAALRRLGRGGGFYDATLAALGGLATRVGLAFECQLVPALPAEPHDAALDLVATEDRLIGPSPPPASGPASPASSG